MYQPNGNTHQHGQPMAPVFESPIQGQGEYFVRGDTGQSGTLGTDSPEGQEDEFYLYDENGNPVNGGEYGEEFNNSYME